MESLWLSGRALECGIQRSEVQFLMVTHNFFLSPMLMKRQKKNILLNVTSLSIISMHYPAEKYENTQTYLVEVVIVI